MRQTSIILFMVLFLQTIIAQDSSTFLAGVRFQKTHNLYYENGLTFDYASTRFLNNRLHVGFSYVTSRLGSALGSNAINQDNYLVTFAYHFRHEKLICPLVQLDAGEFYADMEYDLFKDLPHTSFILAPEFGVFINPNYPVNAKATLGYHLITGNGESGPGTLFPLFFQFSVFYKINL